MDGPDRPSKKGNIGFDIIMFMAALFVFGLVIYFTNFMQSEMNDELQEDDDIPQVVKELSQDSLDYNVNMWDNAFMFFFVLLWISIIITSFFIDTHPLFLIISLILMVFIIIIAAYMANTYEDFINDEDLAEFSNSFPKMNYVFAHLVEFMIAVFVTTAIAVFGKNRLT